jgi:uncharacterized protein (TIGR03435 family)
MSAIELLTEWALRSSLAIAGAAAMLSLLRVTAASIRLTVWTTTLVVSLAIPALTPTLPAVPVAGIWSTASRLLTPGDSSPVDAAESLRRSTSAPIATPFTQPRDADDRVMSRRASERAVPRASAVSTLTTSAALIVYLLGVGVCALRVMTGLTASRRLRRGSPVAFSSADGLDVLESEQLTTPVTLGMLRPAIVLPADWREWDEQMLDAVLAHERSHISRRDPAWQVLSLMHRSVLWFSPLVWFLHRRMVREAEAASDEAAIATTGDRTGYAEVLLHFMQRGVPASGALAVPMARYGDGARRIDGILDGAAPSRRTRTWTTAVVLAIGLPLAYLVVAAQTRPEFDVASISTRPRDVSRGGFIQLEGGHVRNGRYEVRRATLLDLITLAYGVRREAVIGGTNRLDWDRFDIAARVPPSTRPETARLMLQSLLADRFKLVARTETRPVPTYVLSRGTGALRLKRAAGTGEAGCSQAMDRESVSCRNVTMDAYAAGLQRAALTSRVVVNSTALEGAWDFDLRYSSSGYGIPDPSSRDTGIFDALKEVGLALELRDVPQPVVVVESVNENPSPNSPDVEAALPPAPAEFEVASLKPCTTPKGITLQATPGGAFSTGCSLLELLIKEAWGLALQVQVAPQLVVPLGDRQPIPGLPERIGGRGFQIAARSPVELTGSANADVRRTMLRNLLIDRFKIAVRYEDRPMDVHTLVAVKPQLKPADPAERSECSQSTSPQQNVRGQILMCRNVTMAQFAERLRATLPIVTSESQGRVIDETGLAGAWSFTLTWADAPFGVPSAPGAARSDDRAQSDPAGGVTLFVAVEKQLGLKLERRTRPVPGLVIDHIEENPTGN